MLSTSRVMNYPNRFIVAASAAMALAGCGVGHAALDESQRFLELGNVYQAFHVLEDARPESYDLEFEREYQRVRLLYLLELGRESVYEEKELEGIEYFSRALALAPDNQEAKDWIRKSRQKLAVEATERGDSYRFTGELEEALKAYAEAQEHVPGFVPAEEGKQIVSDHFRARRAKAEQSVRQGMRRLSELRNPEALHDGTVAQDEDPNVEGSEQIIAASTRSLAQEMVDLSNSARELGNYGAALGLLKQAKDAVPEYEGIDEQIATMEREVEAGKLRVLGEMSMVRAIDNPLTEADEVETRLDQAEETIRKAYDLSSFERPALSEVLIEIRQRRFARRYVRAGDLIRSGRHQAALDLYRSIDEAARNGYKDVKARINILEEEMALAQEAYDKAVAAQESGDLEAALEGFREANLYAKGFLDVQQRIRELRAAIEAESKAETEGEEPEGNPQAPQGEPSGEPMGEPAPAADPGSTAPAGAGAPQGAPAQPAATDPGGR